MTDGAMSLHVKRWLRALDLAKILFEDQGYHTLYLEQIENLIRRVHMDGATLLAHSKGAQYVTRDQLVDYIPPEPTATWKPIAHTELVETLTRVMEDRGLFIESEQFCVDKNGARLFGTFDLTWQKMEEYGAAVGIRHATDKSMSIQIAVGARVFVCSNMSFSGEMIAIRKHTSKLDLDEEMDRAMFKYMQGFRRLRDDIHVRQNTLLEDRKVKTLIYDIFQHKIVPMRLFHPITAEYAEARHNTRITGWWLENAFTARLKDMPPAPAFRCTARLGKFFASKF